MNFPTINPEYKMKTSEDNVQNPVHPRHSSVKVKGRVSYVPPTENEMETQTLTFKHITRAQERTRKRQQPIRLEPLPVLKVYQDHKQPEYIYEQNRFQLKAQGLLKPSTSTADRSSVTLPTLVLEQQDTVKKKQLSFIGYSRTAGWLIF